MTVPFRFYTGLAAVRYEPLASGMYDSARFVKFVERWANLR
jgi:hypothetical protein